MLSPDVPALVSRGVLSFLATEAVATLSKGSKNEDKEALRDVAEYALEKGAGHAQVFEDADVTFREYLFDFLKAEGSYKEAATVLAGQWWCPSLDPFYLFLLDQFLLGLDVLIRQLACRIKVDT